MYCASFLIGHASQLRKTLSTSSSGSLRCSDGRLTRNAVGSKFGYTQIGAVYYRKDDEWRCKALLAATNCQSCLYPTTTYTPKFLHFTYRKKTTVINLNHGIRLGFHHFRQKTHQVVRNHGFCR